MRKLSTISLLMFFTQIVFAQGIFFKQWDKRYGGADEDIVVRLSRTQDGGFLLGGNSKSGVSGEKTQPTWNGTWDFWIVRTDSTGNKMWDKNFGGNGYEELTGLITDSSGDIYLGGSAASSQTGDVTEVTKGGEDFWIMKTDAEGGKIWDKRFGGSMEDLLTCMTVASNDGIISAGISNSPASGDKTQDTWGGNGFYYDFWVVKIDSAGNKEWDKRFGGTNDDWPTSIVQTFDGGFIIGGWSYSSIGGDKTESCWDTIPLIKPDYWIIKLDSLGNKEWDKRYGSIDEDKLMHIAKTQNDEYLLIGTSGGGMDGDKGIEKAGIWLIKINSTGHKIWERAYAWGGYIGSVAETYDEGFLISAVTSQDDIGPDKTEYSLGHPQPWLIKTDSAGFKQWDKTILAPGQMAYGGASEMENGCYVIAAAAYGELGGYVSEPNRAGGLSSRPDYWLMKFCEFPTVINELQSQQEISVNIYPNPFSNEVSITLHKENLSAANFTLTNSNGQVIYKKEETNLSDTYTKMLDLHNLPAGVYFVEVTIGEEKIVRQVVRQ